MRKFFLVLFLLYMGIASCNSRIFHKGSSGKAGRELFGKSKIRKNDAKVREPRAVRRAKKKLEAQDRKLKREYKKFIKWSRKRSIDIQTPDVKARMKQDKKDTAARNRVKKKIVRSDSKKAGRKYR